MTNPTALREELERLPKGHKRGLDTIILDKYQTQTLAEAMLNNLPAILNALKVVEMALNPELHLTDEQTLQDNINGSEGAFSPDAHDIAQAELKSALKPFEE